VATQGENKKFLQNFGSEIRGQTILGNMQRWKDNIKMHLVKWVKNITG
jgi:hypothetical protein